MAEIALDQWDMPGAIFALGYTARIHIMHEYSIAYDIYATVHRAAGEHQASKVITVHVDIGDLAIANAEQVEFLYGAICADDPVLAGSVLSCTKIAPLAQCPCGYHGTEVFVCPECGALPELVRGREIVVKNVEIEVDGE